MQTAPPCYTKIQNVYAVPSYDLLRNKFVTIFYTFSISNTSLDIFLVVVQTNTNDLAKSLYFVYEIVTHILVPKSSSIIYEASYLHKTFPVHDIWSTNFILHIQSQKLRNDLTWQRLYQNTWRHFLAAAFVWAKLPLVCSFEKSLLPVTHTSLKRLVLFIQYGLKIICTCVIWCSKSGTQLPPLQFTNMTPNSYAITIVSLQYGNGVM